MKGTGMNKAELLSLANIGKTEINGIPLEVIVYPSSLDGTPWLEIHVDALSPLHTKLLLGQKWVEYITEDECAELTERLLKYKREAEEFCKEARRVVKGTMNSNGEIKLTEIPDEIKAEFEEISPTCFRQWAKAKHKLNKIKDANAWYALGNFTLDLDGVKYVPHWSYWLDRPYYITEEAQNS